MSRFLPAISLVFPLLLAAGMARAGDLKAVRLLEDPQGTRAVVEVEGLAGYKLFTLQNPDRLVLDLPQAQLPAGFRVPGANGAVANVRTGKPTPDTLRLVFDLGQQVQADSRVEREGNLSRLTLTLSAPGQLARVEAASPAPAPPKPARVQRTVSAPAAVARVEPAPVQFARSGAPVSEAFALPDANPSLDVEVMAPPGVDAPSAVPVDAMPRLAAAPPKEDAQQRAPAAGTMKPAPALHAARTVRDVVGNGQRKLVVAIDAGHGGKDPGAHGPSGVHEKNVTLAVARELARQINADPGMRAVLIRDGDVFVPLKQRYMKARAAQADLFISIHADASPNDTANGASVFVLSTRGASSQAARWLADQENAADLVGGVSLDQKDPNLAAVLLDLSQSATMRASDDIANTVLGALKNVGKAHKSEIERANFVVLRSPDVPSMLVETGFITNPGEEQKLNDPSYRNRLASAIAGGVRRYFTEQAPPGSWYAARRGDANAGVSGGLVAGTPE